METLNQSSVGLHFVAVQEKAGFKVHLHVFNNSDSAGLFHGQVKMMGGVKRIGRFAGNKRFTVQGVVEAAEKQFSEKAVVHFHA